MTERILSSVMWTLMVNIDYFGNNGVLVDESSKSITMDTANFSRFLLEERVSYINSMPCRVGLKYADSIFCSRARPPPKKGVSWV